MSAARPLPWVRELLHHQGRTTAWLAGQVGMSRSRLAHVLSGDSALSPERAAKIATVLSVPLSYICPIEPG